MDAELATAANDDKPLTHWIQYLIFICVNILCDTYHIKISSNSSSRSKHILRPHILYAKITSLLHPLHIRPDLY